MANKTIIIAGTFDLNGGKPSSLINKIFQAYPDKIMYNGGNYNDLLSILESVKDYQTVFWMANVDNSLDKVRNVKDINPRCILITSKRNDNDKYCFEELINRGLESKSNLVIEFSKENDKFAMRLFDPLGSIWCDKTTDIKTLQTALIKRISELHTFTRQGTIMLDELIDFTIQNEFIDIIHEKAKIFHKLIQPPKVVSRFLGNVSFRCVNGFPSMRFNNMVIVSRRNVNKDGITKNDFVPVELKDGKLYAYGENKPSVDTPIQVRLYEKLPNINYMMHSHVYIKDAPFTDKAIPCGSLEEVDSIMEAIKRNNIDITKSFSLNLYGHGNTVFATDLEYFNHIEYIKRPVPEVIVRK